MLCRTSQLLHQATGTTLETPLLVPSFSSKGFSCSKKSKQSEISTILAASGEFLTEAFLVSAYDIHYGHIPKPDDMPYRPEMVFVDSGGYETSTDRDYSAVIDALPAPETWTPELHAEVLRQWPEEVPTVFVSYDQCDVRVPLKDQLDAARETFRTCGGHLKAFLIKPETADQYTLDTVLGSAREHASEFGSFDVVGVTEKELGGKMLDRMAQVSKLRRAMDDAGVSAPIHVFGALDPLSVCLYFLAGAEVFDGLTWIRYAYDDGRCVYNHNAGVLRYGLTVGTDSIKAAIMKDNYYALVKLQQRLRVFASTGDFSKLAPHDKLVSDASDELDQRLNRASGRRR
jgi:hypothetical protein